MRGNLALVRTPEGTKIRFIPVRKIPVIVYETITLKMTGRDLDETYRLYGDTVVVEGGYLRYTI